MRVELNSGEVGKDITVNDSSAEFLNLDCNRQYKPRVRVTKVFHFEIADHGSQLFYGGTSISCCATQVSLKMTNVIIGSLRSIPSQLQSVCAGPDRSDQSGYQFNISWDPLPCHLQNGADITGYIIYSTVPHLVVKHKISPTLVVNCCVVRSLVVLTDV